MMGNWFRKIFSSNYSFLLFFTFLLFIIRPYNQTVIYVAVWKTLFALVLFLAIFNCYHSRRIKWIISVLAVPIIILSWVDLAGESKEIFIAVAVLTSLFMIICVSSIIYDVLLRAYVNLETLRGVVCAYFLVAFIFAYIYFLLEYISPGTIAIRGEVVPIFPHADYFSEMLYFSFTTLLTIGYGDIVPIKEWGQSAVVIEGTIGQLYIALLVARIVSVYSFISDKRLRKSVEKNLHDKN